MRKLITLFIAFCAASAVMAQDTLVVNRDCAIGVQLVKDSQAPIAYDYVDLGLSVKWATCNVGAANPWEYGDYFAWGETVGYGKEDRSNATNYAYTGNTSYVKTYYYWAAYKYCSGTDRTLTKYCNRSDHGDNGYTDTKTVLDPEDDAATVNMGGSWRMPTYDEINKLINNCYWEWTDSYNGKGVKGYIVYKVKDASDKGKRKYSGGSVSTVGSYSLADPHIFLPAAGYRGASNLDYAGVGGNYWSSSLGVGGWYNASCLEFYPGSMFSTENNERSIGRSVRGVIKGEPIVITVTSNNAQYGTVSGGGTYINYSTATLTATPKSGYTFKQWNDGNTENPRTVTVTGDKTYTATFEGLPYIITANSANTTMGTVSGSGTYAYNTTAALTATPKSGYKFVRWNDGNTENPRTVTVTGNKTYTATFAVLRYTITANSVNTTMGTVSGGGTYINNSTATLTATPKSGYTFKQWNDGNTENPRTVTVTGNKTYTATFEGLPYIITANSANTTMGTVNGSGTYAYNTTARLTATPKTGYQFVRWNDGNTQNPRTVNVYANATYTAIFKGINCNINVYANFNAMGIVDGGGVYEYGTIAGFVAIPINDCHFVQWNDGSTENPRYVKVQGDKNYTAEFGLGTWPEETHGATVNNDGVSVTPYETKAEFTWPSITGVASYSLIIWADEAQGKKVCTLTFNANGQLTNIDFTQSVKPQGESVEGLNFTVTGLKQGTTYGYTLDAKDAEDDVIETKHGTFTTMGADGIADITAAGINIYTEGRTIIVENATDAITVSDALGRVVGKDDAQIVPAETRKFPVPSSGVYVVKIGNRSASVLVR